MTYSYQWRRCNSSGLSCVDIPDATASAYVLVADDVGSTLRVVVTDGVDTVTSDPSAIVTAPAGGGGGLGTGFPDTSEPSYTPTKTISTPAALASLLKAGGTLASGDVVEVEPMTVSGEFLFAIDCSAFTTPPEIHFLKDAGSGYPHGAKFTGVTGPKTLSTTLPAVWFTAAGVADAGQAGLLIYNGDISNDWGDGLKVSERTGQLTPTSNSRWWGAYIHACGGQGLSVQAGGLDIHHLDFAVEVNGWGTQYTVLDPHTEKGTGVHGSYIGGGNSSGKTRDSRFIVNAHDGDYGAGCEAGPRNLRNEFWLNIANLNWTTDGNAGSGFQPFGVANQDNVVKKLIVDTAQRTLFSQSLTGGAPAFTVEEIVESNIRLSPSVQTNSHLVLP